MRVTWKKISVILFVLVLNAPSGAEELEEVLSRIQAAQDGIKTAQFRVQQTIRIRAPKEEQTIKAEVQLKRPDKFRLHYEKPQEQYILTNGKKVWTYVPEFRQVTIGNLNDMDFYKDVVDVIFFPMDRIRENYRISKGDVSKEHPKTYPIRLVPRTDGEEMIIFFHTKSWLPVEMISANEEASVTTKIKDLRINPGIPDGVFEFSPPPGAEIINLSETDK